MNTTGESSISDDPNRGVTIRKKDKALIAESDQLVDVHEYSVDQANLDESESCTRELWIRIKPTQCFLFSYNEQVDNDRLQTSHPSGPDTSQKMIENMDQVKDTLVENKAEVRSLLDETQREIKKNDAV